jgi:hypothetical protein
VTLDARLAFSVALVIEAGWLALLAWLAWRAV